MTKDETVTIDTNHEIEEFLQKYIVEKIITGCESNSKETIHKVNDLRDTIKDIKNRADTTNQDIAILIRNDNSLKADFEELREIVDKITKKVDSIKNDVKTNIVKEDKMAELVSSEMLSTSQVLLSPICCELEKCNSNLAHLVNSDDEIVESLRVFEEKNEEIQLCCEELLKRSNDISSQIMMDNEMLKQVIQLVNQSDKDIIENKDQFLRNCNVIIQGLNCINQKVKFLWILVGMEMVAIIGMLLTVFYR